MPPHRMTPLKNSWEKIVTTIVVSHIFDEARVFDKENMKLQIRMNVKKKNVEIRNSEHTVEKSALQKGADFLKIFMLGNKIILKLYSY